MRCLSDPNAIASEGEGSELSVLDIVDGKGECEELVQGTCAIESCLGINIDSGMDPIRAGRLRALVDSDYLRPVGGSPKLADYCMEIRLTNDTPVYCAPRRLSYRERCEVKLKLGELLSRGIIRPSESPYASPIVLVRRKNGDLRMCVDYRALNRVTLRDNYPLPVIEDCLDYLGNKNFFSILDLENSFHQVPMHRDSIKYTAFVTPLGQFEYCYMPFGLKNAGAVFQRFINGILRKFIDEGKIVVYLDDISIATETFDEHLSILGDVLRTLRGAGLKLNLGKCKFAYSELDYLGYRVNANGIRPNGDHIRTISEYPMPSDFGELERCLGLFSFFRRFVRDFSRIARPLTKLRKGEFKWTDECTESFSILKERLVNSPVLAVYDPRRETELHTDASSKGYGSVLLQKQADGKFHPVAYYSKSTTPAETRYHSFELETLAIIYALRRFRIYLEGIAFTIVTDCNSLALTLGKRLVNPRIARWALELENYDYTIRHRKGELMSHVDALSRNPLIAAIEPSDVDVNIQIAQSADESIENIRRKLEREDVEGYTLDNGLVFRCDMHGRKQLYVPAAMEDSIMQLTHEKYGHVGIEKCIAQIQKHYWFPNLRDKMGKFIGNCLKCIYYTSPFGKNQRNLHSIEKKPIPFDTLHIDHFGPLPSVNSKRKHVLVIIDAFTKFTKLYAVNSPGTKEACCALQKYFEYYSRPRRVITDRGTCFTSAEFAKFVTERNVVHVRNSVASPQSNGQVERINRVIRVMLAKLTEPYGYSDWVERLRQVEFAINNTTHCTTKQAPSRMLFGVEQRGEHIDELTEYLQENYARDDTVLDDIRKGASEAIGKSQLYNSRYFERHHRPARLFEVGDLVVLENVDTTTVGNRKFLPKYRGPYVVRKRLGNDRYQISDLDNYQVTQIPYMGIVDSTRLRKWLDPKGSADNVEADSEGNTDEIEYTDYEFLEDECVEEGCIDSNI